MLPINITELLEHNQDHKTGKVSKRPFVAFTSVQKRRLGNFLKKEVVSTWVSPSDFSCYYLVFTL